MWENFASPPEAEWSTSDGEDIMVVDVPGQGEEDAAQLAEDAGALLGMSRAREEDRLQTPEEGEFTGGGQEAW